MIVHLQFPQDYPQSGILVELKSKTLSEKLLNKLVDICDQEMKKYIGKQQVNIIGYVDMTSMITDTLMIMIMVMMIN